MPRSAAAAASPSSLSCAHRTKTSGLTPSHLYHRLSSSSHILQIICVFILQLITSPPQIISPCSDFPLIMPFIMRRVKMSGPDDPRTILQVTSQARARCACDDVCARTHVCSVAFRRSCAQRCTSVCMEFMRACGVIEGAKGKGAAEGAWTVPEGVRVDFCKGM